MTKNELYDKIMSLVSLSLLIFGIISIYFVIYDNNSFLYYFEDFSLIISLIFFCSYFILKEESRKWITLLTILIILPFIFLKLIIVIKFHYFGGLLIKLFFSMYLLAFLSVFDNFILNPNIFPQETFFTAFMVMGIFSSFIIFLFHLINILQIVPNIIIIYHIIYSIIAMSVFYLNLKHRNKSLSNLSSLVFFTLLFINFKLVFDVYSISDFISNPTMISDGFYIWIFLTSLFILGNYSLCTSEKLKQIITIFIVISIFTFLYAIFIVYGFLNKSYQYINILNSLNAILVFISTIITIVVGILTIFFKKT